MNISESRQFGRKIETIIDIAVAMSDYTQSPERCREIPSFLAQALNLDDLTLAVVRQVQDDSRPQMILCSFSRPVDSEQNREQIINHLLDLHQRFKFENAGEESASVHILHERQAGCFAPGSQREGLPEALVFARSVDRDHDLLLMVHRNPSSPQIEFDTVEDLRILTNELSKQLLCMIGWHHRRFALGKPFSDLTEQEWVVLRALTSVASEKEIAHQLQMRPHTLHSRIKSIYRKVRAQGRLPLIQKFNDAVIQMRINLHRAAER